MIWLVAYVALALLLIFRGLLPMLAVWRASDPKFVARPVETERSLAFTTEECDLLRGWGYEEDGVYELVFPRQAMLMHLWVKNDTDRTLCSGVSRPNGARLSQYFSTFVSNGVGWFETRVSHDMPPLPGEIVQSVPGADLPVLAYHHEGGLQRLSHYGIAAGPVVALDGIGILRHQLLSARAQMREQPLSWFVGTLLYNVRPLRTDLVSDDPELRKRLVQSGLLQA